MFNANCCGSSFGKVPSIYNYSIHIFVNVIGQDLEVGGSRTGGNHVFYIISLKLNISGTDGLFLIL